MKMNVPNLFLNFAEFASYSINPDGIWRKMISGLQKKIAIFWRFRQTFVALAEYKNFYQVFQLAYYLYCLNLYQTNSFSVKFCSDNSKNCWIAHFTLRFPKICFCTENKQTKICPPDFQSRNTYIVHKSWSQP